MQAEITRRTMLKAGATTALTVAAGCGSGDDEFGGYCISVTSYSFREFTADETVAKIAALGIANVDLWPSHMATLGQGKRDRSAKPYHLNPNAWSSFQSALQSHGMHAPSYGVLPFSADHEANRRIFAWAKEQGFETFMADPSPDSFDSLERLVEEFGLTVGIHNHGPEDENYGRIEQVVKVLNDRHPLIGTCVDLGHFFRAGDDPVDALKALQGRIYGIHIKDVVRGVPREQERVVIGEGEMDIPAILRTLREIKYDGYITYEHENNWDNPAPYIARSLEALRQMFSELG